MLLMLFLLLLLLYSAISRRVDRTVLTAPILFTLAGVAAAIVMQPRGSSGHRLDTLLTIAELGLTLTLFSEASRTNLRLLGHIRELPTRLLTSGMLLTLILGWAAAYWIVPGLSVWEAGALSAILAPTDAGLGLVIVNSPRVPERIRQALNVEAGLNDGLSVPFLMFFIAMAATSAEGGYRGILSRYAMEQLGFGAAVGLAIGLGGGFLLGWAHRKEWMSHAFRRIGVVTLPLLCALASEPFGASMFIAAFVAGLVVQIGHREVAHESVELAEEWGQMVNLAVFFFFGITVAFLWPNFTPPMFLYALLSLTLIRMLPVWIALRGTEVDRAGVLFMGWFGPRGLASIVLGLIYLDQEAHSAGAVLVRLTVALTVLMSIFAHGLSAQPGIRLYARMRGEPAGQPAG